MNPGPTRPDRLAHSRALAWISRLSPAGAASGLRRRLWRTAAWGRSSGVGRALCSRPGAVDPLPFSCLYTRVISAVAWFNSQWIRSGFRLAVARAQATDFFACLFLAVAAADLAWSAVHGSAGRDSAFFLGMDGLFLAVGVLALFAPRPWRAAWENSGSRRALRRLDTWLVEM